MKQNYKLVGATTYATSKAIFTKGGVYSEEVLGDLVEATVDGTNDPLFVPVNEPVTPPPELEEVEGAASGEGPVEPQSDQDGTPEGDSAEEAQPATGKRQVVFGKKAKAVDPDSDIAV